MLRLNTFINIRGTIKYGEKSIMQNIARSVSSLVLDKGYINGQWVNASSKKTFEVFNPATEKVVGHVPDMNAEDTKKAIDAAYNTFHTKEWINSTAKERSTLLKVCTFKTRVIYDT